MKLVTIESPRMAAVVEKAVDERYFLIVYFITYYNIICILCKLLKKYLSVQKFTLKYQLHSDIEGQWTTGLVYQKLQKTPRGNGKIKLTHFHGQTGSLRKFFFQKFIIIYDLS